MPFVKLKELVSASAVDRVTSMFREIYQKINGVWTRYNDGAGTGLDADMLDALHGSAYPIAMNRQDNNTNNDVSNQREICGWGFIQGTGSSAIAEFVTLPFSFDDYPLVSITPFGSVATSGGTPVGINAFTTAEPVFGGGLTTLNNRFTVYLYTRDSSAMPNTKYYGYTWRASGTKAR